MIIQFLEMTECEHRPPVVTQQVYLGSSYFVVRSLSKTVETIKKWSQANGTFGFAIRLLKK